MSTSIRVDGALRSIASIKVMAAGSLRPVKRVRIMAGGQLRTVYTVASSAPAFTVQAIPGYAQGNVSSANTTTVTSNTVTATVDGGVSPYSYSWSIDNPAIQISAPTMAGTAFYARLYDDAYEGTATCLAVDASGQPASCNVAVLISHGTTKPR